MALTDRYDAAGLFGPGSMAWRVDGELVVLAGGSCALLMQAAHPVVAAGVLEHSTYATDPVGRLRRTLATSFEVVFGTASQARSALARVNAIHRRVRGTRPDDAVPYTALDPDALLWVHATLVETALRVYGRFVAPLAPDEEQAYHEEATAVAELLGVPRGHVPATIGELRAWMEAMIEDGTVRVTDGAREIADTVLRPIPWVPRVAWDAAHLVSIAMLPASLRRQYDIGWSAARERGIDRIAAVSRAVLPRLPAVARRAPSARAAARRVGAMEATIAR